MKYSEDCEQRKARRQANGYEAPKRVCLRCWGKAARKHLAIANLLLFAQSKLRGVSTAPRKYEWGMP